MRTTVGWWHVRMKTHFSSETVWVLSVFLSHLLKGRTLPTRWKTLCLLRLFRSTIGNLFQHLFDILLTHDTIVVGVWYEYQSFFRAPYRKETVSNPKETSRVYHSLSPPVSLAGDATTHSRLLSRLVLWKPLMRWLLTKKWSLITLVDTFRLGNRLFIDLVKLDSNTKVLTLCY